MPRQRLPRRAFMRAHQYEFAPCATRANRLSSARFCRRRVVTREAPFARIALLMLSALMPRFTLITPCAFAAFRCSGVAGSAPRLELPRCARQMLSAACECRGNERMPTRRRLLRTGVMMLMLQTTLMPPRRDMPRAGAALRLMTLISPLLPPCFFRCRHYAMPDLPCRAFVRYAACYLPMLDVLPSPLFYAVDAHAPRIRRSRGRLPDARLPMFSPADADVCFYAPAPYYAIRRAPLSFFAIRCRRCCCAMSADVSMSAAMRRHARRLMPPRRCFRRSPAMPI